ncbi:MAG: hypothetical protein ACI9QL_002692 [Candidatus Omnitrophota bacterium]
MHNGDRATPIMSTQPYDKALTQAEQRISDLEKQIQYVNQLLSKELAFDDGRAEMQELLHTVQEKNTAS